MSLSRSSFGSVCHLVNGKAFKPTDWSGAGVPIIRIQNLNGPDKPFNYWAGALDNQVLVKTGDLLLAWSGTPGTSFGAHIWSGPNGILNQHIFRCDLDQNAITKEWARIAVNHRLDRLIEQAHGGVGLQHVTRGMVEDLEIALPSLAEQRRIAELLDRAEALRVKRRAALAQLDFLTQSIFLDLFGDLRKHKLVSLESLASAKRHALSSGPFGSSLTSKHYVDEGILVLRGLNVTAGEITLHDCKFISESKARELSRSLISPMDIVIVAVGASGFACLIPKDFPPAVMSQNFNKISPNLNLVDPTYLVFLLNSSFVQRQFFQNITDTVRTFLSLTKIKKVPIPLPPIELQREFARRVGAVEKLKTAQRASLAELDALFASLQHRAFRGEL